MVTKQAKPTLLYDIRPLPGAYAVCRDGTILTTPAGADFVVTTLPLAQAIAEEWRNQTDKINLAKMPLTQLAYTAIDIVEKKRVDVINQLVAYVGSELLCHYAESPAALVAQQQQIWQPILDWCTDRFDIILEVTAGIMPIAQHPETVVSFRRTLEAYGNFHLTGLWQAVDVSGSLVLGLALTEGHLNVEEIFNAAELDVNFQIQKWGEDPAISKRRESVRHDLSVYQRWFELLR
jgi:chaperone required for assembly of F1-ATPase